MCLYVFVTGYLCVCLFEGMEGMELEGGMKTSFELFAFVYLKRIT